MVAYILFVILLVIQTCQAIQDDQKKCYALAISGGGTKVSYQLGVVHSFAHLSNESSSEYEYDVVSGVSAGSINNGIFSLFPKGNEKEMTEFGANLIKNFNSSVVFRNWPHGGVLAGLTTKPGIFDNTPLWSFLNETVKSINATKFHRKLVISSANVNTGQYHAFNESVGLEDLGTIIKASASIPAVFPPTEYKGDFFMDGGTEWNTNIVTAINRCLEVVENQSQIVLDVIISDSVYDLHENKTGHTLDNFLRKRAMKNYFSYFNDYFEMKKAFPEVTYRHLVQPSGKVPMGAGEIDFSEKMVSHLIEMGKKDGLNALKKWNNQIKDEKIQFIS